MYFFVREIRQLSMLLIESRGKHIHLTSLSTWIELVLLPDSFPQFLVFMSMFPTMLNHSVMPYVDS